MEGSLTKHSARNLALALLTGAVALTATPALASCGPHKEIVKTLAKKYLEAPKAFGTVNQTNLVEVYVSAKGSWTILLIRVNGSACIIAAGQDWEDMPIDPSSLGPEA